MSIIYVLIRPQEFGSRSLLSIFHRVCIYPVYKIIPIVFLTGNMFILADVSVWFVSNVFLPQYPWISKISDLNVTVRWVTQEVTQEKTCNNRGSLLHTDPKTRTEYLTGSVGRSTHLRTRTQALAEPGSKIQKWDIYRQKPVLDSRVLLKHIFCREFKFVGL